MPYGLIVVESLLLPWHATAGRSEICPEQMATIAQLDAQTSLEQSGDAAAASMIALLVWQARAAEIAPQIAQLAEGTLTTVRSRPLC